MVSIEHLAPIRLLCCVLLFSLLVGAAIHQAAAQGTVYATWEGREADKCGSIWLIQRFVAPEATIRFVSRGTPTKDAIAFDTPEALLRRDAHRSTFEALLQHHGLDDATLQRLGRIIHDIEINTWERKATRESTQVEQEVRKLTAGVGNSELVDVCRGYFDELHRRLGGQSDGVDAATQ
jgi:hypothetical protein